MFITVNIRGTGLDIHEIKEAIAAYTGEEISEIYSLDGGHINKSLLVTGDERYVLQRMNQGLYADQLGNLEHNYIQYRTACENRDEDIGEWYCPEWMRDGEGEFFHRDSYGNIWRMYRYIPADDPAVAVKKVSAYAIGLGLGNLHRILEGCDDIRNITTTEHIHDLWYHYRKYLELEDIKEGRDQRLDELIKLNAEGLMNIHVPGGNIIHGDAKAANMVFRDGRIVGFVDLDTVKRGSRFDDLADCMRSTCIVDGRFDPDKVALFAGGYCDGADTDFTSGALGLLGSNLVRNRFMLGLRYYTDHLSQEGYFAEEHPGQSLEKARFHIDMARWEQGMVRYDNLKEVCKR